MIFVLDTGAPIRGRSGERKRWRFHPPLQGYRMHTSWSAQRRHGRACPAHPRQAAQISSEGARFSRLPHSRPRLRRRAQIHCNPRRFGVDGRDEPGHDGLLEMCDSLSPSGGGAAGEAGRGGVEIQRDSGSPLPSAFGARPPPSRGGGNASSGAISPLPDCHGLQARKSSRRGDGMKKGRRESDDPSMIREPRSPRLERQSAFRRSAEALPVRRSWVIS
jgi:hypothetical protein